MEALGAGYGRAYLKIKHKTEEEHNQKLSTSHGSHLVQGLIFRLLYQKAD